jgi:hypothetical protein
MFTGPTIVKEDLVLHLDAANTKSYVSGSTTWRDLSGNNNSGSLTNGPTFSSANGGSIVLNGTNQYGPIGTTGFPFGASPGTLSGWANTNTISGYHWILSYGTANNAQSRFIGIGDSTYYFGGYGGSPDITYTGVLANVWFNIVGVYDGTNASMYINGVLKSGPSAKSWNTVSGNAQIGRQTNNNEYWGGNIASTQIYNRALSATEISQNFNATKGRFGL